MAFLVLGACAGGTPSHATHGGSGGGTTGQSAGTKDDSTALKTYLSYSGSYHEHLNWTAISAAGSNTEDADLNYTFSESVSLSTPKSVLAHSPTGTPPVSSSLDRAVYFSETGTLTVAATPNSGQDCQAKLSGKSGISDWQTTGALPPVEIDIEGVPANGASTNLYGIQVNANLPLSDGLSGLIQNSTPYRSDNPCYQQGYLGNLTNSPGIYADSEFQALQRPGPRESPFLVLPLKTTDYTKQYKVDKSAPFTALDTSGTDTVKASTTLTVNDTVHLYAALGDSFSSGAFNPIIEGQEACSQSIYAYPVVYDLKGLVFLACSGASTTAILDSEVPGIPPNAQVVSLTAGGDDMQLAVLGDGLFGMLKDCVVVQGTAAKTGAQLPCASVKDIISLLAQLPTVQAHLQQLIAAIHEQAPEAKIFVLGYPNPMPPSYQAGTCPGLEQGFSVGAVTTGGISSVNASYFYLVVGQINKVVHDAVTASGGATYVEPFTGHDVCDPSQSWFVPLSGGANEGAPLHPNRAGHAAMAQALSEAAGPPP